MTKRWSTTRSGGETKRAASKRARRIGNLITAALLACALSGCASILQGAADVAGVDVVSESAKQKAFKAAKIAFVAWGGPLCEIGDLKLTTCKAGGIQGLALMYRDLPLCRPGIVVCYHQEAWDQIKVITRKTTAFLASAEPLIRAGSNDVELLLSLPGAVYDAQAAINAAQQQGN
jgi:hypothetical protein